MEKAMGADVVAAYVSVVSPPYSTLTEWAPVTSGVHVHVNVPLAGTWTAAQALIARPVSTNVKTPVGVPARPLIVAVRATALPAWANPAGFAERLTVGMTFPAGVFGM